MGVKNEFDTAYRFLLGRVLGATPQLNKRTGKTVKAVDGACFRLHGIPILNLRDINVTWTCAETVWFTGGRSDAKFMRAFGFKNWDQFTEGDGNTIRSATGYRWRVAHDNVDQLKRVIEKLDRDISDRQAVMISWLPGVDLVKPGPNAPCLLAWHVHYINGELHMTVMQRSADLYFGLPHDILGARLVQEIIAAAVDVPPGNLTYVASNAHLYEDQWKVAEEMIRREESCSEIAKYPTHLKLTSTLAKKALDGDSQVVEELLTRIKKFYTPFPPLSGPRLAV